MYEISEEAKWRQDREGLFSIRFAYSRERIRGDFGAYIHLIITGIIYVAFAVFTRILITFFSLME
jgi:hypothetical protein